MPRTSCAEISVSKRFGFADAASAAGWIGDILWDTWAITTDNCSSLVISGANLLAWIMSDDKPFIAKWSVDSQRFQRLSDTAALAVWLHDSGLPVAAPVPARDGRLRVELDNISLGVFPVIEGVLLDAGDLAQAAEAGRMLATLHEAMAAYPRNIDGGQAARHEQLVHNDFRSANLLYEETGITAVLDLEDVAYRSRVSDLAKAAVLLATQYRNWEPTSPLTRETFIEAYRDQAPLTISEQHQLQIGIDAVMTGFGWAQAILPETLNMLDRREDRGALPESVDLCLHVRVTDRPINKIRQGGTFGSVLQSMF